jgi:hypothetical protein
MSTAPDTPPPLPPEISKASAKGSHQRANKKQGCLSPLLWIVFLPLFLLYVYRIIEKDLQTAAGRQLLITGLIQSLSSCETYISGAIMLFNTVAYFLLMERIYPTRSDFYRGIGRAVMCVKNDDMMNDTRDGSECWHFFVLFFLPTWFIAAGIFEFKVLNAWYSGTTWDIMFLQ